MLAAGGGESGEGLFISGGDEAEVGVAGVEEVVLVLGESKGSFRWWGEAGLDDLFAIDEEACGVASAKEEAVGSGGEGDF